MRWLNICRFLWHEIVRDVVLTLGGLWIVITQVTATHVNPYLIGAGVALTAPATYQALRQLGGAPGGGSSGPLSPPPGEAPPTPPGTPQEVTK